MMLMMMMLWFFSHIVARNGDFNIPRLVMNQFRWLDCIVQSRVSILQTVQSVVCSLVTDTDTLCILWQSTSTLILILILILCWAVGPGFFGGLYFGFTFRLGLGLVLGVG